VEGHIISHGDTNDGFYIRKRVYGVETEKDHTYATYRGPKVSPGTFMTIELTKGREEAVLEIDGHHATYSIKEIRKRCDRGVEEIINDLESLKQRT